MLRYLRAQKPELGHSVKELSHGLKEPNEPDWQRLKTCGRYLLNPTKGLFFPTEGRCDLIDLFTDSDWAGDKISRKSSSGANWFCGGCLLGDHSKQQGCIALSSAEAETYAAVAGLSTVLLHMSLLIYLGFEVKKIVLWTDSKAAKAIICLLYTSPSPRDS